MLATIENLDAMQGAIYVLISVFVRVGATMALMPAFGEQMIPLRVRLGATLAFTAILFPVVQHQYGTRLDLPDPSRFLSFGAVDLVAGLVIGIGLRLMVMALQTAGTIAAQATSLAQLYGGMSAEPQPAISNVFVMSALVLAVMSGLHVKLVELFILSYEIFPPGAPISSADVAPWGIEHVARVFALAFILAAPFAIASLVYNLALGVINRAMPQLMVAFVGAPAITAGALLLLVVSTPLILVVWHNRLDDFITSPTGAWR